MHLEAGCEWKRDSYREHEMSFARDVSSEVIFLHEGRVEEQGEPQQMFSNPKSERFRKFLSRTMN